MFCPWFRLSFQAFRWMLLSGSRIDSLVFVWYVARLRFPGFYIIELVRLIFFRLILLSRVFTSFRTLTRSCTLALFCFILLTRFLVGIFRWVFTVRIFARSFLNQILTFQNFNSFINFAARFFRERTLLDIFLEASNEIPCWFISSNDNRTWDPINGTCSFSYAKYFSFLPNDLCKMTGILWTLLFEFVVRIAYFFVPITKKYKI